MNAAQGPSCSAEPARIDDPAPSGPVQLFYREIKRLAFPNGMWSANVQYVDGELSLVSFVVAPFLADVGHSFFVDDRPLRSTSSVPGPELVRTAARHLIARLEVGQFLHGPTSVVKLSPDLLHGAHPARISLRFGDNAVFPASYYLADFSGLAAPGYDNMMRTGRNNSLLTFNFLGISQAIQILSMAAKHAPERISPDVINAIRADGMTSLPAPRRAGHLKILDWGVGCGRCSRFMAAFLGADSVFGADVDPVNMAWVKSATAVPDNYQLLGPHQRMPFPDNFFDLIYGISVMTHLSAFDQAFWLEELVRVLRPDGIAILTTHGLPAFFCSVNNGNTLAELTRTGFNVNGVNTDLDKGFQEHMEDKVYLNVFNTPHNIWSGWSRFFDVVEILPATSGQQDYVILRCPNR